MNPVEIRVTEHPDIQETQVNIICRKRDEHIERLIELILTEDEKLYGKMPDGALTKICARELLYVESVDGRCLLYRTSSRKERPQC